MLQMFAWSRDGMFGLLWRVRVRFVKIFLLVLRMVSSRVEDACGYIFVFYWWVVGVCCLSLWFHGAVYDMGGSEGSIWRMI